MALKQGILSKVRENNETKLGVNENVSPRQNKSLFLQLLQSETPSKDNYNSFAMLSSH